MQSVKFVENHHGNKKDISGFTATKGESEIRQAKLTPIEQALGRSLDDQNRQITAQGKNPAPAEFSDAFCIKLN